MLQKDKLLEIFNFRYACKRFSATKKISQEYFGVILESARLSPSSFGFEPWKFLVLNDKTLRNALKPVCWGGENALENASEFVVILARKKVDLVVDSAYIQYMIEEVQKIPSEIQKIKKDFFHRFLAEDFGLLKDDRKIFDWAGKQCYIALANMLTAAAALGIDSCAIEGFNEEAANKILSDAGIIDTAHFGVCVMVAFGYRDNDKNANRPKTRQSLEKIVQYV
ncbi:NAD(P)H-dependent oxidoreductase [Helicobacter mesocricetorum]|uniref:NAD(P)H-dependent oxidoreductase n=1 Tax=Helicobacter mesocricetorum TaxID=87012 RepID=UPI000CF0B148|nr:NAD(P)H-dependent oxidoreductase [Helicobacter mesocricetorum]